MLACSVNYEVKSLVGKVDGYTVSQVRNTASSEYSVSVVDGAAAVVVLVDGCTSLLVYVVNLVQTEVPQRITLLEVGDVG